jgi:hypothetical protein
VLPSTGPWGTFNPPRELALTIAQFQLATAIAWFVVALLTVSGTLRLLLFSNTVMKGDVTKSAFFFVGGSSRWLLRPDDVLTWKLVYAMSILLALYVCVIVFNVRRDR